MSSLVIVMNLTRLASDVSSIRILFEINICWISGDGFKIDVQLYLASPPITAIVGIITNRILQEYQ